VLESFRSLSKYIWIVLIVTFVGGFLLVETSGLLGRAPVTATTSVAVVNGREVPYQTYLQLTQNLAQQEEQRLGRGVTLDERARIEDQAFNQLVTDILLQQEYDKRSIRVTDQEIVDAAKYSPPPQMLQAPELQTDGRFDPQKYQRFLASPAAKQQGLLVGLESYYKEEIPRQKLFQQVASNVWVSDSRLWSVWQDQGDSVTASFVQLTPEDDKTPASAVSDAEISQYYAVHKGDFDRPGRAIISLLSIPRIVTAADSAAARARVVAIRNDITSGKRSFEDAAKQESSDSVSGKDGGNLGSGIKGRFVADFEKAAYALKPGQLSEPVLTQFGYHLIRVEKKAGDTLTLRHILVKIAQSDSSATATDRRADSLASMAGGADKATKFDSAAKKFGLTPVKVLAVQGEPVMAPGGKYVPSVSAWAFGGARAGEASDLYDSEDAYWLARLDSLQVGGQQPLTAVKDEIKALVQREKQVASLVPRANALAARAVASSLEDAAKAQGLVVTTSRPFTRLTAVSGLGRANESIGAAFALPVGAISAPVVTKEGVVVLRVDKKVEADRTAWEAQKKQQRDQVLRALREARVREWLAGLRKSAKLVDKRREIMDAARRQT
jgi:peptidyl-prolyl cis-trans isomerase D